jgi:UDP-glucuronate 4-epimerase
MRKEVKIFVTGAVGFIGFHTSKRLLDQGATVHGYDNINDYYDPYYKELRLEELRSYDKFSFTKGDLADSQTLGGVWKKFDPSHALNLAAQAGVRYSIENPMAYVQSNLVGFQNVIELVRETKPQNFVYASSSSVYGSNKDLPFAESQNVSNPISLYAATKLSNELVAKAYGHLFELPSTGLRFFTVYGPFGRPDMAMFKFAEAMRLGKKLPVFGEGKMGRDFTFVDDIVAGTIAALNKPEIGQVYNLGRGKRESLLDMIEILEVEMGFKATYDLMPMQAGDVRETTADIVKAKTNLGYNPKTDIREGIPQFAKWYMSVTANRNQT